MKNSIYFGFVFLLLLTGVGCSPESPERITLQAEKAFAEGNYAKAIHAYEALLQLEKDSAVTYQNLALSAYHAQDFEYAKQAAQRALKLAKAGPEADVNMELLGLIAEEEKDFQKAITLYRQLRNSTDRGVRVRAASRLARIYADQNKNDGAFVLLLSALHESNQDPVTFYNLAKLCVREPFQLRQAALDYFRQAERLLPTGSPQARDAKNWVSRLEKNLARLQEVPPATGDAKACADALERVRRAKARKNWRTAEDEANRAVRADPSSFAAALELGRTCAQNKRQEKALKAYDTALALRSDSVEARAEAAQLAYDMKRYAEAATYLRPALVAKPRNHYLADLMMRILAAQRKLPEARLWGEYYLLLDPKATESYRNWVYTLPEA